MSGGDWERYSAVLVESNRQLREHLDEALRRLRLNADELELAREHNKTLLALLDRARRELEDVRSMVTVESQGGH